MQTPVSIPAEVMTALATLDTVRMLEHAQRLCSPSFAGRRVGTEGHARASTFLAQQLRDAGLKVTTQEFALTAPVLEQHAPLTLTQHASGGSIMRMLSHRTEFCVHPRSASRPDLMEGRATLISETASVEGAWVILEAVPVGSAFTELVARLARKGAVGILTPLSATEEGYLVKRIMAATPVALPVLSVRTDLLPLLTGSIMRATVPVFPHLPHGYNLLAYLNGTDPQYVDAPLLIGAHYDGVGDDLGGRRLEGATDNAAAVAVLLELARVLALFPRLPRRPLVLVAFDAEEAGAQGSRAIAQVLKEQGKKPLVLNLDGAACRNKAVWVEPGAHTHHP